MGANSVQARSRTFSAWFDMVRAIIWRLRNRQGRTASLGLFVVVFLVSGSLAVIPRLVTRTTNQGVVAAVNDAIRVQPGLTLYLRATLPGGASDPMANVVKDGQQFQAGLAPAIQNVVTGNSAIVESQRFSLINPIGPNKTSRYFQTFLTLRYQSGLDQTGLVTLDNGQLPQAIPPASPTIFQGAAGDLGDQPLPAFQIALDQNTAQALKLNVGDRVILQPDPTDSKTVSVPAAYLSYKLIGEVSGIFQPANSDDRYWREDTSLLQPAVLDDGTTTIVYGYGLIAPAAYPTLLAQTSPVNWSYTWRYEVDPSRVNAQNNQALKESMRSLLLTHGSAAELSSNPLSVTLQSPLVAALDQFNDQRDFLVSAVVLATLGVGAVAVFLLILVGMLLIERDANETLILRDRGADARQLLGARFIQTAIFALPAVTIGYVVAWIIIPVHGAWLDLAVAAVTGLLAIGMTMLAALPGARLPLGRLLTERRNSGRDVSGTTQERARRIAVEVLVVLLAAAGIYLVRRRGLLASSGGGIDPYLALVPFLAGLTAGILMLRLYSIPVRILIRIVQRGQGIVVWAGLRRVARQRSSAQLPMLALLVAVGVAVFTLVVQHSLAIAQNEAVWQTVGADERIDAAAAGSLPKDFNFEIDFRGEAVAPAYYQPHASVNNSDTSVNAAVLLAINPINYLTVTDGTPAAVQFPPALTRQPGGANIGTRSNPLPAIISTNWPGGIEIGQLMQVTLESVPYWIEVSGKIASFPSLPVDDQFIVTSSPWLQAANPDAGRSLPVTRIFVRGSGGATTSQLQQSIKQQAPGATLTTRTAAEADNSRQLLAGGVADAFRYSVVLVTLFAAAAGSIALMLSGAERRRDLSYLRTLGLSARQAFGITIVEQLPPVLTSTILGSGLGVAIALLISPALDLSAFAGRSGVAAGIAIDWWQIAALSGGISVVVLIAIISFGLLTRHLDLASALRLGDQ